ncbi:hypothetical protein FHL15_005783 [Xylaria flabelliformis]|uniref:CFEM domain-containing protein n=1 Tax=Xylaria flabelliformis TaxID=2512241 RepID=A0A553HZ30_9PEZI|nr:hypothetical protein FHL15_005783 [Xylaria flabelliformis]
MKYTVAALAFAAAVSAQSLSDVPACALPCIDDARTKDTTCGADDYKCICDNITKLQTDATSCVLSACGADTALNQVLPAVQKFCAAVESGGGATSEPSSTPSSTPTSEPTSMPTSESTASPTSEPTGYPTELPTSSQSTVTVTSQSSYPGTTSAPTNPGGNTTATTSPTQSIPTAGAAVAGSIGSFAMLVLGALAAF